MANGHFSQFLLQANYKVDAFAFGPPTPLVRHLHQESLIYSEGSEMDPVGMPYPAASFDAVASVGVLEHVRETNGDELASLREIRRVLTPNGLFFCFHFPNRYSWIEGMTSFFRSRFHHTYRYTKDDIIKLAAASGFEVIRLRRYNAIPRNIFADFPRRCRHSRTLASIVDVADQVLAVVINPFAQNYGFVLRKPATQQTR